MKNTQKGFTLVELIVVITILAILGTIAFISLQGYSQDAKNSKAISDVRTLASAVETRVTEGVALSGLVTADASNAVTMGTYGSGKAFTGTNSAGDINFVTLGQDGSDFGADTYKIGTLVNTSTDAGTGKAVVDTMYQVVGVSGPADALSGVVKGNYIYGGTDTTGLVSAAADSTPVENGVATTALN